MPLSVINAMVADLAETHVLIKRMNPGMDSFEVITSETNPQKLRGYQLYCVELCNMLLNFVDGALLNLGTGLGKTACAVTLIGTHAGASPGFYVSVVVIPPVVAVQMMQEFERLDGTFKFPLVVRFFSASDVGAGELHRWVHKMRAEKRKCVALVSKFALSTAGVVLCKAFIMLRINFLVVDESDFTANRDSISYNSIRELRSLSNRVLLMSATVFSGVEMERQLESMLLILNNGSIRPAILEATHTERSDLFRAVTVNNPAVVNAARSAVYCLYIPFTERLTGRFMQVNGDLSKIRDFGRSPEAVKNKLVWLAAALLGYWTAWPDGKFVVYVYFHATMDIVCSGLSQLFPGKKILNIDGRTEDRTTFLQQLAAGEWDVAVVSILVAGVGLNIAHPMAMGSIIFDPQGVPAWMYQTFGRLTRGNTRQSMVVQLAMYDFSNLRIGELFENRDREMCDLNNSAFPISLLPDDTKVLTHPTPAAVATLFNGTRDVRTVFTHDVDPCEQPGFFLVEQMSILDPDIVRTPISAAAYREFDDGEFARCKGIIEGMDTSNLVLTQATAPAIPAAAAVAAEGGAAVAAEAPVIDAPADSAKMGEENAAAGGKGKRKGGASSAAQKAKKTEVAASPRHEFKDSALYYILYAWTEKGNLVFECVWEKIAEGWGAPLQIVLDGHDNAVSEITRYMQRVNTEQRLRILDSVNFSTKTLLDSTGLTAVLMKQNDVPTAKYCVYKTTDWDFYDPSQRDNIESKMKFIAHDVAKKASAARLRAAAGRR